MIHLLKTITLRKLYKSLLYLKFVFKKNLFKTFYFYNTLIINEFFESQLWFSIIYLVIEERMYKYLDFNNFEFTIF